MPEHHHKQQQNTTATDTKKKQLKPDFRVQDTPIWELYDLAQTVPDQLSRKQIMQLQRQLGNQATGELLQRQMVNTIPVAPPTFFKSAPAGSIQRKGNDDAGGGGDDNADEKESGGDKLEVDASDPEVQEQEKQLDSTVSEANDVKSQARAAASVAIDDDDPDADMYADMQPDYDPDANLSGAAVPKSVGTTMGKGAPSASGQLPGTKVAGQQIAAEGKLATTAKGVANTVRTGDTALDAKNTYEAIKAAIEFEKKVDGVDAASDAASGDAMSGLEKVAGVLDTPPINILLPIATLLPRVHLAQTKQKQMRAYKKMMEKGGGSKKDGKDKNNNLQSIGNLGSFGYAKTLRGFWLRVAKAAINVGQIITRMISLIVGAVTAGVGALVSEAADAALSLSQGVIVLAQSVRALIKIVTRQRGKKRLDAANIAIKWAIDGDEDILDLLVNGEVFGVMWWQQREADYQAALITPAEEADDPDKQADNDKKMQQEIDDKAILSSKPKNNEEMKEYLEAAKRQNLMEGITAQILISLKST